MSHAHSDHSITIVGAGLVGSALALALTQQAPNCKIRLVDPLPWVTTVKLDSTHFDARVVALNAQSVQLLASLGGWQRIMALRACAYNTMAVWDGEGTANIHFTAAEVHQPQLGFIVENSVAIAAMHQALEHLPQVQKINAAVASVDAETRQVHLDNGEVLTQSLLLAADGGHSKIRTQLGVPTRTWSYGQSAIITTVKTEKPHAHTAWQRFTDDGPLAFLPLTGSDDAYCSIVWSLNDPLSEQVAALDDAAFCRALTRAFEAQLGEVQWADKRTLIPLTQMHVQHYAEPGVALLGDAAHTIHPLAGQGVNLGLRDVQVMSEEVAYALGRNISLADASVGRRYQRRVQTHNLLAMGVMEGFKRLFVPKYPGLRLMRNWGLKRVAQLPMLKRELMQVALGHAP